MFSEEQIEKIKVYGKLSYNNGYKDGYTIGIILGTILGFTISLGMMVVEKYKKTN